jgi:CRP/FNR family transcriptional regulator, cyclic AMP receptor protein
MDTFVTETRTWTAQDAARLLISQNALTELTMEESLEVVRLLAPIHIAAETVLIEEGVTSTGYMALVLEGEAVVVNSVEGSDEGVVLSTLGAGAVFGELGILDGKPRSATVTAVTDMDIAVLDRVGLARLIDSMPGVACSLLSAIIVRVGDRLRATNSHVQELVAENRRLRAKLAA